MVLNNTFPSFTFPNTCSVSGSAVFCPRIVPVFNTNWFVLKSALSKKANWYSCERFSGRTASFRTLKCRVLTPVVLASAPSLLAGRSSARRKAVWPLKIDWSEMRTSTGWDFASMSNW